jgi:hypothetical protein
MKLSEIYASSFIKAQDLDQDTTLTIKEAGVEEIGQDKQKKLVLAFHGTKQKFVLNNTNAKTIGKLYGDDIEDWYGKRITLRQAEVEYKGEMVLGIRVSLKKPAAAPAADVALDELEESTVNPF